MHLWLVQTQKVKIKIVMFFFYEGYMCSYPPPPPPSPSPSPPQLLDCFTILAVMVLSYVFLKTRYKLINIMGVLLTVIGIACLVFADFNSSRNKGGMLLLTLGAHAQRGLQYLGLCVCLCVCVSVKSHLTSRMSNRAINEHAYLVAYERQKICGDLPETTAFKR